MKIQVEELTQVLRVLPKTLSPPSPFPFSSLPFFRCQTSRPWERACARRICASWVVQKAREAKKASLLCPGTSGPWREAVSLACKPVLPAASPRQAGSRGSSRNPSRLFSSVSGDAPGCAKPDSFKTALYECLKFLSNKGTNAF